MARDTLFALGLLFSMASQLRVSGSTVLGPGELCLALWVIVSLGRELARLDLVMTPPLGRMLGFWAMFAVAESLGTLTGAMMQDQHDEKWFLHDVLAYILLAGMSCLSVAGADAVDRLRRVAWLLVVLGSLTMAAQLAAAAGAFSMPGVDPWYWDRLRGWAATPNQLSLVCIALVLLSFHLSETSTSAAARTAVLAGAILPAYAGWLTQSDTFNIVLVLGGPAYAALKFRKWIGSPEWRMSFRSAFAWIVVLVLPIALALFAPLGPMIADEAGVLAKDMSKEGGKATAREADLRFHLWGQAIQRGVDAHLLGLGPGPHLSIPTELVAARQSKNQPINIAHPTAGAVPNFEAHNTPLDLFAQGGVLADLAFVWLSVSTIRIGYRGGLDALTVLVGGLVMFGMFHLIIRQPIFWYSIGYCLVGGTVQEDRRMRGIAWGRQAAVPGRLA